MKKSFTIISIIVSVILFASCSKDGNVNLFTVKDDLAFGAQLDSTILADPVTYPILPYKGNEEAYKYVEDVMNLVLESEKILYRNEFKWQVRIINQDVLNAFAAPGGYLYFYTGFLKYCRSEAEFAGVMAHEIAHADRRHSTETLTKVYGLQILLSIAMGGNAGQLTQIAAQLALGGAALKFSRKHEYEADEYSLRYLVDIQHLRKYDPTSIIDFFDHLAEDSLSNPNGSFEFLRTHPYDANRKENVNKIWVELGNPTGNKYKEEHNAIIAKLP